MALVDFLHGKGADGSRLVDLHAGRRRRGGVGGECARCRWVRKYGLEQETTRNEGVLCVESGTLRVEKPREDGQCLQELLCYRFRYKSIIDPQRKLSLV